MQHRQLGGLALAIILISACASAPGAPATPTQRGASASAVVRTTPAGVAERIPAGEGGLAATPMPSDSELGSFITPEGYYGIGRIDAPNLIVMYSDVF